MFNGDGQQMVKGKKASTHFKLVSTVDLEGHCDGDGTLIANPVFVQAANKKASTWSGNGQEMVKGWSGVQKSKHSHQSGQHRVDLKSLAHGGGSIRAN